MVQAQISQSPILVLKSLGIREPRENIQRLFVEEVDGFIVFADLEKHDDLFLRNKLEFVIVNKKTGNVVGFYAWVEPRIYMVEPEHTPAIRRWFMPKLLSCGDNDCITRGGRKAMHSLARRILGIKDKQLYSKIMSYYGKAFSTAAKIAIKEQEQLLKTDRR